MVEDCGVDCLSTTNTWRLGVNHHRSCVLSDGLDHVFSNSVRMVSLGRTWFVYCAASGEQLSEGLVVIISVAIIAPKSFYFVSHGVNSGLERLVG